MVSNEDVTQQDVIFQCTERRFILDGNFQVFGTKVDLNQRKLFIIYQTASNVLLSVYPILYWKASSFQIVRKDVNET